MALKVVCVLLCFCVALSLQEKVKVSVYYESLCPDSISFIKKQLYPTYLKLNTIMEVELIPYGKAIQNKVNGKWEFECQHGPNECAGNKLQACALHQNYTEAVTMEYINCVMSKRNPPAAGETCSKTVSGVTWTDINACYTSSQGDDYLAEYGDQTHSVTPQISFVPTITFNDVYNDEYMWDSLKDLKGVVCKIMKNPSVCTTTTKQD